MDGNIFTQAAEQGPFSEMLTRRLQPSMEQPERQPTGWETPLGTVAMLGSRFLEGAQKSRLMEYARSEQERQRALTTYLGLAQAEMANPDLTPEGQALVRQRMGQVLGQQILQTEKGGKGKGAEGAKGIPGIVGHVFKEIAIGMTGGQMPKGKPVNIFEEMGKLQMYVKSPEYSVKAQRQQYNERIDKTLADLRQQNPNASDAEVAVALSPVIGEMEAKGLPIPQNVQLILQTARKAGTPMQESAYAWFVKQGQSVPSAGAGVAPPAAMQPTAPAAAGIPAQAPAAAPQVPATRAPEAAPFPAAGAPGLLTPGNIDLNNRPLVRNPDGTYSSVRSISVGIGGKEVLIPTVSEDARVMSDKEALDTYQRTGRHLGIFSDEPSATAYAKQLHIAQASRVPGGAPAPSETRPGLGARLVQGAEEALGAATTPIPYAAIMPPLPSELLGPSLPSGAMTHLRTLKLIGQPEAVLVNVGNRRYNTEATRIPEGIPGVPGGYYHEQTGQRIMGDVIAGVKLGAPRLTVQTQYRYDPRTKTETLWERNPETGRWAPAVGAAGEPMIRRPQEGGPVFLQRLYTQTLHETEQITTRAARAVTAQEAATNRRIGAIEKDTFILAAQKPGLIAEERKRLEEFKGTTYASRDRELKPFHDRLGDLAKSIGILGLFTSPEPTELGTEVPAEPPWTEP